MISFMQEHPRLVTPHYYSVDPKSQLAYSPPRILVYVL
jgi:hypothetical protein